MMSKQDWQELSRRYAYLFSPTGTDARIALEYILQHEVSAANCYANDPDPAGVDQLLYRHFYCRSVERQAISQ
ncbi:MAG: hypothetical protein ACYDBJ_20375 [Aggregatilineales bacterium]